VRLVHSSAFLVSVYMMEIAHSCETKHIRLRILYGCFSTRLRFLTSTRSILNLISFSFRSFISQFNWDISYFSYGVKWSMSSVPISSCFLVPLALSWSILFLTSASVFPINRTQWKRNKYTYVLSLSISTVSLVKLWSFNKPSQNKKKKRYILPLIL
jgi:hypothetical protein